MYPIEVDGFKWAVQFRYAEVEHYGESPYFTATAFMPELVADALITVNRIEIRICEISRRIDEHGTKNSGDYYAKNWRYANEMIKRGWGVYIEPTDAVKSKLRSAGEKAILAVAKQVGDEKWKLDAKRAFWQNKYDRQILTIIQEKKVLSHIEGELRWLGIDNNAPN